MDQSVPGSSSVTQSGGDALAAPSRAFPVVWSKVVGVLLYVPWLAILFSIALILFGPLDEVKKFEMLAPMASVAALAILITYRIRASQAHKVERLAAIRASLNGDELRTIRAQDFYLAAESHGKNARWNSISSLGVLVMLIFFVGFAGKLVNQDTVTFATPAGISDEIRALNSTNLAILASIVPSTSSKPSSDYLEYQARLRTELKENKDRIQELEAELKPMHEAQMIAEREMGNPIYRMASSFLIRISVIGLAIYLVTLLNRWFKYNNAMAALYRARFNATMASQGDADEFVKFASAYGATDEYDVNIEHPIDKMNTSLQEITRLLRGQSPPAPQAS